jgi:cysteinyl-tRNA synthetase
MSLSLLGHEIDLHAGGLDLVFPHHQNEIAQSEAATGHTPFVRLWLHNGFVNVSGDKMSKSLGNFATIAALLDTWDADTIRYFVLTHHYGKPVDFTTQALEGAANYVRKTRDRISRLLQANPMPVESLTPEVLRDSLGWEALQSAAYNTLPPDAPLWLCHVRDWFSAMRRDLNTPEALAALNPLLTQATVRPAVGKNTVSLQTVGPMEEHAKAAFKAFLYLSAQMGFDFLPRGDRSASPLVQLNQDRILKLRDIYLEAEIIWRETYAIYKRPGDGFLDPEEALNKMTLDDLLSQITMLRQSVREAKNWQGSDTIRDRLAEIGLIVEDHKEGASTLRYESGGA